ncbi:MAG: hypothetical protein ACFFAS_16580 [Promethearchaeota archaeon]
MSEIKIKKKRLPSDYFCVICGRNTNNKSWKGDPWSNYFFSCIICKKVWCATCMGALTGLGPKKTFKLGKKGNVRCNKCEAIIPPIKLPVNLPFKQKKDLESQSDEIIEEMKKFCPLCEHKISVKARFCENCGGEL